MTDELKSNHIFKFIPDEVESSSDSRNVARAPLSDPYSEPKESIFQSCFRNSNPNLAALTPNYRDNRDMMAKARSNVDELLPPPPTARPPPPRTKPRSATVKEIIPPPVTKPPPPKTKPRTNSVNSASQLPIPPPPKPPINLQPERRPGIPHVNSDLSEHAVRRRTRKRENTQYVSCTAPLVQEDHETILSFLENTPQTKGTGMKFKQVDVPRIPARPKSMRCIALPLGFLPHQQVEENSVLAQPENPPQVVINNETNKKPETPGRPARRKMSLIQERPKLDDIDKPPAKPHNDQTVDLISPDDPTFQDENGQWRKLPEVLSKDQLAAEIELLNNKLARVRGHNKSLTMMKAELRDELRGLRSLITDILVEADN